MKNKVFTLVFAFLAMAGNAIWGQSTSDNTIIINGTSVVNTDSNDRWSYESNKDGATDNNVLEIKVPGTYIIESTGTSHPTTNNNTNVQILIQTEGKYYITLKDVRTDAQLDGTFGGTLLYPDHCAFQIGDDSKTNVTVELDWEGSNKFWSGAKRAGINVKPGATLILNDKNPESDDSLEAGSLCNSAEDPDVQDTYGAGIGGDFINPNFGEIIIENGTVLARCESKGDAGEAYAAGIGGGYKNESSCSTEGTIIIKGGKIEAASWSVEEDKNYTDNKEGNEYAYGAGIGGGYKGTCTNIAILGGNVTANAYTAEPNKRGNDIGVGYEYNNGITQGIIIGQWDKNTKPTLPEDIDINETNYLNGTEATKGIVTVNGEVTMPDKTQVYIIYKIDDNSKFNAYNVKLNQNVLGDSHDLSDNSNKEYGNRRNYYYGANMSFTEIPLACNQKHLFMGWYDANATTTIVPIKEEKATFIMPSIPPASLTTYEYDAVWVDNEYTVTVKSGTQWTENGENTPRIEYTPNETIGTDALNIIFTNPASIPNEIKNFDIKGNQITGTPTLQDGTTATQVSMNINVKLGTEGTEKTLTFKVNILKDYLINSVDIAGTNHVYNGKRHNGIPGDMSEDYVLEVKATKDFEGNELPIKPTLLKEGVAYTIYSYTFQGKDKTDEEDKSLDIIHAGDYTNIKIKEKDALLDNTLDTDDDGIYALDESMKITVAKREMNVTLQAKVSTLDELNRIKDNNDVASLVEFEEMNYSRGLVEGEEPEISGTIFSVEKKEGTDNIYLVTINRSTFTIGKSETFWPSDYKMTIGEDELTNAGQMPTTSDEDLVIEVEIKGNDNDNTNDNIHIDRPKKYYHIYIDTVCPGLQLELSKDSVIEGGQVSVYLTVEEKCDTTGFTFEYKRGLKKWWQDLKPLEGVQPGEYIIKNIYSDIYIQALDAILEIEEEPTGIEDVEGAKVYAKEGTIYVYTPNHERVMIVSMNGAIVKSAEQEGMQSYSLNRGIYIVRIGDKVFKIKN